MLELNKLKDPFNSLRKKHQKTPVIWFNVVMPIWIRILISF